MSETLEFKRLSDRILFALQLALEQEDVSLSERLNRALEETLTRKTGGKDFVERRDFTAEYNAAMDKLYRIRNK
ncbi:MAG TPA: hypothetical protein VIN59_01930 [Alphaproteobacteria bacterium]